MAHPRVGTTHGSHFAAHHHGRIQSGHVQNGRGHRGGGGFSVTSGDGDAVFQTHQLSQHFAARDHGDGQSARFLDFRVLIVHGGADHDGLGARDVGRGVAFENPGAELGQTLGGGAELHVRARDLVSQIEQHLGDSAHTDPADTNEVQVL